MVGVFIRSNSAQYFQNRQTIHNPMDLPNTYPTVPELSIANKDFRLVLGDPKEKQCNRKTLDCFFPATKIFVKSLPGF